jgi:DNA polymerase-3 subunit gamma/tau
MSYTVLARKYRPQIFADLVGQEHVSRTLANAIKADRVAHALLFTGARGVGKTTTARLVAKALNCEQGPTPEPCNNCDPCREITIGTDLDVLEIDGASNNSVDDVRRLQESLPYRPARDRYKIVIVDEVHMLSTGAFNAFLKTLEEPPPHVKFIFATTEIHKVPITIRSRCQRHDFRLIPHAMVAAHVKAILAQENIKADDAAIAIVVREAAGSLRDALTVLDQLLAFGGDGLKGEEVARGLGIASQESVLAVAEALLGGDAASCLRAVATLAEQGLDIMHFARQLLSLMRDIIVLRVVGDDGELVDRPEDERKHAARIGAAHGAQQLERTFAGLSKLLDEVGESGSPQVTLEMGLVRLADRPALEPLSELLARLHALEQRLASGESGGASSGRSNMPGASATGAGVAAGPGPKRAGPPQAPAPHELRPPVRPEPRRAESSVSPRPGATADNRAAAIAPAGRSPQPTPPADDRVAGAAATRSNGAVARPSTDASGNDGVPQAWREIVAALHQAQPALGAVLEHGVPVRIDPSKIVLSFPEGSFFGRQATSDPAREALADAAERVLGQRPAIEVGFGLSSSRPTVAAQETERRKERRAVAEQAALSHPRVKDALDVFPEAEGNVNVEVED